LGGMEECRAEKGEVRRENGGRRKEKGERGGGPFLPSPFSLLRGYAS